MNIIVLNGSPKGNNSVTLQYIEYMKKKFPGTDFKVFHISQTIRSLYNDKKKFDQVINSVREAHAVIWATPVYYLLVPSQYLRFIELIYERKAQSAFKGKYAAVVLTSIHFFDHTARNYLNSICDDLSMRFYGSFTPDMYDLMSSSKRKELEQFTGHFISAIKNKQAALRRYAPASYRTVKYQPGPAKKRIDQEDAIITLVTESEKVSANLAKMIKRFATVFTKEPRIVRITDMGMQAPCIGCCKCGYDNICTHKDGFAKNFDEKIKTSDIIIYAADIRNRYLTSTFKCFIDRSFYNGHVPSMSGKQFGFILSGPLSQCHDLRQVLEAMVEMQSSSLAGIVTDEAGPSAHIDGLIDSLADQCVEFTREKYSQPVTFLGAGGRKIFRDNIWGRLRFVFQMDHEYYKKHRSYDFPQKRYKDRLRNLIMMGLTKIPSMRKEIAKRTADEMVKPLKNVVKNTESGTVNT